MKNTLKEATQEEIVKLKEEQLVATVAANNATGIDKTQEFIDNEKSLISLIENSVDEAAQAHNTTDKELIVSAKDKIHRLIAEEFKLNEKTFKENSEKIALYINEVINKTIVQAAYEEVGNRVREENIQKMSEDRIKHFDEALTKSGYELIFENAFEKIYAKQNSQETIEVLQYDLANSTTQIMYDGIVKAVMDNFADSKDIDFQLGKYIKDDPKNKASGLTKRMNRTSIIIGSGRQVHGHIQQHMATSVHKAPWNQTSALIFTNIILTTDSQDKMGNASIANTTSVSIEATRAIKEHYTKLTNPQQVEESEGK